MMQFGAQLWRTRFRCTLLIAPPTIHSHLSRQNRHPFQRRHKDCLSLLDHRDGIGSCCALPIEKFCPFFRQKHSGISAKDFVGRYGCPWPSCTARASTLARKGDFRFLESSSTVQGAEGLIRNSQCDSSHDIEDEIKKERNGEIFADSEVVTSVCTILKCNDWGQEIPEELNKIAGKLTPELAYEILRQQKDAELSANFLKWTGKQKGFKHRVEAFVRVIGQLGREKKFASAWEVLKDMQKHNCETNYAFTILLHRLCMAKRFKEVAEAVEHMKEFKVIPTLPIYSLALRILFRGNCLQEAQRLYHQMIHAGFSPDIKLYKILLVGMGRNGRVDDVCRLYEEMKVMGLLRDPSIYNALINIFSRAGKLDKGYKLFEEMIENNYIPRHLTDHVLACALYGEKALEHAEKMLAVTKRKGTGIYDRLYGVLIQYGKVNQAVELHRRTLGKVEEPRHILYWEKCVKSVISLSPFSILISGLCASGNVVEALKLYQEMLQSFRKSNDQICNCLLLSLSNAGMMTEAINVCHHIIKYKLSMSPEAQREFFCAYRRSGHLGKSFKLFEQMKSAGCIAQISRFDLIVGLT